MGVRLLDFIKNKVGREQKLAFIMTFVMALLIHMYKFTNTLLNHDSLYNVYDTQNILGSGRWVLQLACGLSSYYDLPWLIGVVSCVFIALTAAVVVGLLRIRNPVLVFLWSGLLASAPATTETFFFQFTADGYMIAMLLAALGVWFSRIDEKRISRYVFSGICLCVSCGIYQAYISFALVLALCYFIQELLCNTYEKRDCYRWILRQVIIYPLSLGAYYGIWKWRMAVTGIAANPYLGISKVGSISVDLLIHGFKKACRSVADYFLQLATIRSQWPLYTVLNVLLLTALAVILVVAVVRSGIFRRPWAMVLLTLCLAAIVPFAGIWCFTSYELFYRPMMLQSLTLVFLLAAILYEQWANHALVKDAVALLLAAIILNNTVIANVSYFYMNVCYERSYAEGQEMAMRIREIRDESVFWDVAVLGDRYFDLIWDTYDPETGEVTREGQFELMSSLLEESLLVNYHTVQSYLSWYLGTDLVLADVIRTEELKQMQQVQNMPVWPAEGSIQLVGETLVIKLTDVAGW